MKGIETVHVAGMGPLERRGPSYVWSHPLRHWVVTTSAGLLYTEELHCYTQGGELAQGSSKLHGVGKETLGPSGVQSPSTRTLSSRYTTDSVQMHIKGLAPTIIV